MLDSDLAIGGVSVRLSVCLSHAGTDTVYLTCSKKLTGSQLSLPHGTNEKYIRNKKYVLSNSESVQCNFFIFDHVTFIQFKICCCVQNFIEIGCFFAEIWRYIDFQNGVRPELFDHRMRQPTGSQPTKSLLLAAAACQISCQSDTHI